MTRYNQLESTEYYHRRYRTYTTRIIWPIILLIIMFILFLCFAKKEITVKTIGQISPKDLLITLQSSNDAEILINRLKENKVVHKGETLLVFNDQERLMEQRKGQLNRDANQQEQTLKLKSLERYATVKAPADGVLHLKNANEKARYLPKGSIIAEIYPELANKTKLDVSFAVPAQQMNNLKVKQKIRFYLEQTGPKPSILNGIIREIDFAPTKVNQKNIYLVRAELKLKKADYDKLRYGLEGKVSVITGRKTWLNYIKDLIVSK